MPLKVQVFPRRTDRVTREEELAHLLKSKFELELQDASGRIVIHANASLYGYGKEYREVDLLVFAQFDTGIRREIQTRHGNYSDSSLSQVGNYAIWFQNACWVIEVKDHDRVNVSGQTLMVTTKGSEKNVSAQSDGQKNGLRDLTRNELGVQVSPTNLIWLPNIEPANLPTCIPNLIGSRFSVDDLLMHSCKQKAPMQNSSGRSISFRCTLDFEDKQIDDLASTIERFSREAVKVGIMTRQRLERITRTLLGKQQYAQAIGEKLVIIQGRAGTGKTVKLLHIAHDLASRHAKHVQLLTYNKALVSDIRRICALSRINDTSDGLLRVDTVHSFVWKLMDQVPLFEERHRKNFLPLYEEIVETLAEAIENGLLSENDIQRIRLKEAFRLDHVMIDEAQDWLEAERRLMFGLFEPKQFVIADGIDQLVRRTGRTAWTDGLGKDQFHQAPAEKRSLRQKPNLNRFISAFCKANELEWDLQPSEELTGGRVVIVVGDYTHELHSILYADCKEAENEAYEMLFMAPPKMVLRELLPNSKEVRHFALRDIWNSWGLKLWDGTDSDIRKEYPTDILEHRVVQYDSCRGLEAWTAICLQLDSFFDWKKTQWADDGTELALYSEEEQRRRFALRWTLIPFTRAIDTLVITLASETSPIGQTLKTVANQLPDIVEWVNLGVKR